MKEIAIYGAGGFGREVACLLNAINAESPQWNFIGFFDDVKEIGSSNEYGEILGGIDVLNSYKHPLEVVIAIGSSHAVSKIVEQINNPNIEYPNIIAPDVRFVDKNNISLGKGNVISWGSHISCNVHIGNHNILNCFITIGHDVNIGDFNAFMPGVRISGNTCIGNENFFGVGSAVLQNNEIGFRTVVGANSVIMRNTKSNATYVGNPATIIKY